MTDHDNPAAFTHHPLNAVLKDGETFEEFSRKVQFCEITWPQCWVIGEPIYLERTDGE